MLEEDKTTEEHDDLGDFLDQEVKPTKTVRVHKAGEDSTCIACEG